PVQLRLPTTSPLHAPLPICSSGVTLDRYCGSGITTVAFAAAQVMSGMEDLVIAGGTEMMSMPRNRGGDGPPMMDSGNLRLRAKQDRKSTRLNSSHVKIAYAS